MCFLTLPLWTLQSFLRTVWTPMSTSLYSLSVQFGRSPRRAVEMLTRKETIGELWHSKGYGMQVCCVIYIRRRTDFADMEIDVCCCFRNISEAHRHKKFRFRTKFFVKRQSKRGSSFHQLLDYWHDRGHNKILDVYRISHLPLLCCLILHVRLVR